MWLDTGVSRLRGRWTFRGVAVDSFSHLAFKITASTSFEYENISSPPTKIGCERPDVNEFDSADSLDSLNSGCKAVEELVNWGGGSTNISPSHSSAVGWGRIAIAMVL